MFEYKVITWNVSLGSSEELEKNLNEYAKEGWKVNKIIQNTKGFFSILFGNITSEDVTIIMERTLD